MIYKICFYVPQSHLDDVKSSMFKAGAGRIGHYSDCAWQVAGTGQFRPLAESDPFQGKQGELETVEEFRVEMVCEEQFIRNVVDALRESHPYEEPAYDVVRVENF